MQLENNFTCICSVPQLQEVTDVEGKQSHSPGEDALSKEGSATSSKKKTNPVLFSTLQRSQYLCFHYRV